MMRLGWGNFALKRPRGGQNRLPGRCERRFWEQLNAHSEQLNATMCHQCTDLVAFTLGSHERGDFARPPLPKDQNPTSNSQPVRGPSVFCPCPRLYFARRAPVCRPSQARFMSVESPCEVRRPSVRCPYVAYKADCGVFEHAKRGFTTVSRGPQRIRACFARDCPRCLRSLRGKPLDFLKNRMR